MELSQLTAVSPIDGRYASRTRNLRETFSEYGLIKFRLKVEVEWFLFLASSAEIPELAELKDETRKYMLGLVENFSPDEALKVKAIEQKINHDVKAVEYYLKDMMRASGISQLTDNLEFVHFACTSEDINNLSHGLMLKEARSKQIKPGIEQLIEILSQLSGRYRDEAMVSRTHGQVASPTTMGKEMANFVARLKRQSQQLSELEILGKKNGAVGNFNAHLSAYPDANWPGLGKQFVESLGLSWNAYTTQIEPHDYMAEYFHCLSRINTILMDLDRDIWSYISIGYFKQRKVEGETGSSTMPHKVNPIDFENSEGNLGLSNALLIHLAEKLPISRWQRDLTDSTALRNMGAAIGYSLIAYQSTLKGLGKLELNRNALQHDLDGCWEVLAEPIQTIMRKHGMEEPYEQLKNLTRGQQINKATIEKFIDQLELPESAKAQMRSLTPASYIGSAAALVDDLLS